MQKKLLTIKILQNMIGGANDKTDFLPKLLLTNKKILSLHKIFSKHSSAIKLSETRLYKTIQPNAFLGKLLVLTPLRLTATASAAEVGIYKKILGLETTTLIMTNK